MQNTDPIELRNALTKYFNIKDLQDLCFIMEIPYEDLGGNGRSVRALHLVQYTQRRGRLDELAAHVHNHLEQMPQQDMTAVEQEAVIRLLHSIQADVESLLTAVGS